MSKSRAGGRGGRLFSSPLISGSHQMNRYRRLMHDLVRNVAQIRTIQGLRPLTATADDDQIGMRLLHHPQDLDSRIAGD